MNNQIIFASKTCLPYLLGPRRIDTVDTETLPHA